MGRKTARAARNALSCILKVLKEAHERRAGSDEEAKTVAREVGAEVVSLKRSSWPVLYFFHLWPCTSHHAQLLHVEDWRLRCHGHYRTPPSSSTPRRCFMVQWHLECNPQKELHKESPAMLGQKRQLSRHPQDLTEG